MLSKAYHCVQPLNSVLISLVFSSTQGISANRSKLIAWYVSDCNSMESHREDYASFLANYLPVDIYGPCGNLVFLIYFDGWMSERGEGVNCLV